MKPLSLVVALFAAIVFWASQKTGDRFLLLLVATAIILAVTTYRAHAMSSFLKVLAAFFATETVIFGLIYASAALGFWPDAWADYSVPESLPLAVGVFGIIIYAVSHVPLIRKMMKIADPFFETPDITLARIWPLPTVRISERRLATMMIVFLVLINQFEVLILVRLNSFNRDWFDAIQNKDQAAFWYQLVWVFTPWAFVFVTATIFEYVVQSVLIIRWRRWLTDRYVGRWLRRNVHYRMALAHSGADNPDQRIAEDVRAFIDPDAGLYGYTISLIATLTSLVSFSIVLWELSANFSLPLTDIKVPGFLFWVALIYAAVGTFVTHMIGFPLAKLFFSQQRFEADFRFSVARLREYTEQVALLSGEPTERSFVMRRFGNIFGNYLRIMHRRKWLLAFTSLYGQISPIIPYIVASPFYFAGKITLGVMTQTASAFGRVDSALNWFVTNYVSLANFIAVLDRLTTFDDEMGAATRLGTVSPNIERIVSPVSAVKVESLTLALPNGRVIVEVPRLDLIRGQSILLTGPSGSGKSTLFRAISGIWPYGQGRIVIPSDARIMLLPQRPYIPMGSLRDAIVYPAESGAYDEAAIRRVLSAVRLSDFADRIYEDGGWAQRLSGGEQQRVAVARALLAQPDWLFLDEATSALDEKTETIIYQVIAEQLPSTTIVSIGHRSTLLTMHHRHIDMEWAATAGCFTPRDVELTLAEVPAAT
jgi:putative ATP-binding cassette transporter